jgi:capsid protein
MNGVDSLQWSKPASAAAPAAILHSRSQQPFGPDDPSLTAATMALANPLWNGPQLSAVAQRGKINARFDNSEYDDSMRKHWAMADYLGPDAAANPGVRYILRIRSRYEVANNSYARGIVTTIANDTIGRGPNLHLITPDENVNREVKTKFMQWSKEIDLPGKLRTMRMAKCQDGEGFCVQANRNITQQHLDSGGCPLSLDLRIFEADQCATVSAMMFSVPSVDGIELDEHFQPKNYFILRIHPGNYVYLPGYVGFPWDYDTFPAAKVCHWYRKDRPELHRGIPEITPALNLFAQLRDFTTSILKAARIQSSWAIAIQTNAPAGLQEVASVAPMDTFEFEDGMALTMPQGWSANGLSPTQPTATYVGFKKELLCEIGRCLNMPLCVIAGDSSGYNYASGRLDFQVYRKSIQVDRADCETVVLDKIFRWWIDEAVLIDGYLPPAARRLRADLSHEWLWGDDDEHVDPTKEASATQMELANGTTNLAIEIAKKGRDWRSVIKQRGEELRLMEELGIPLPQAMGIPNEDSETGEMVEKAKS